MARAGMMLNVVMVPVVLGAVLLLGPWIFGLEFDVIPAWAVQ
jgi:hypothetical protein